MNAAIALLVFLPVFAVWVLALHDVLTRKDIGAPRRALVALALLVVFPLTILYLLARPPSSARRGSEAADDPRAALVDLLDSQKAREVVSASRRAELTAWVATAVHPAPAGAAPGDPGE